MSQAGVESHGKKSASRMVMLLRRGAFAAGSLLLAACGTHTQAVITPPCSATHAATPARSAGKPNIIFILADDLSANELQFMPNIRREIFANGATFDNYFANISLCCSARASIFTGQYAHNTGIVSNVWPGGFYGYERRGIAERSFPYVLKNHGYFTSLMGKYLNGYPTDSSYPGRQYPTTYVPQGWSDWAAPTSGQYRGVDYNINVNGQMQHLTSPTNFLSDYTNRRAEHLIACNGGGGLFIEMSDFGPHYPSPSSPLERNDPRLAAVASRLIYPRTASFNERNVADKPRYMRSLPLLGKSLIQEIDQTWRHRFYSVKTLDRHVGELVQALRQSHQLQNTYLLFASDNGFHMGEHRLVPGKNSEYDTDIKLPFAISGPGIRPGQHVSQVVGNIDIAPTLLTLAGLTPPSTMDGESMLPLMQGRKVPWRQAYFVQKGYVTRYNGADGALEPGASGEHQSERRISRFIGAVDGRWRLFWYNNGSRAIPRLIDGRPFRPGDQAFYDTAIDPLENNNLMATPKSRWTPRQRAAYAHMTAELLALADCRGPVACRGIV